MNSCTFIVPGTWCRFSSSAKPDVEAQSSISSTYGMFPFPAAPEPARITTTPTRTSRGTTTNATDDFFGATRGSRHNFHPSLDGELLPPPYTDAQLPAYSADSNTEPATLAMYLFKFGFLFPPLWILGAVILISPLTAPAEYEPSKSEVEQQYLVQIIRDTERKWARRCVWAVFILLILASLVMAVALVIHYS